MRLLEAFGVSRIVVVRPNRLCDTPVRHRELRIEFGGVLKRAGSFVVIEGVNESQALIKKLLRFRITRGDGMMKIAEAGYKRDGMNLRVCRVFLGSCDAAQQ